jgi:hypothetical protein
MTDDGTVEGRANEPWTHSEVDLAVAAYFDMWADWLRGIPFVKRERVAALKNVLGVRSHASIERKLMNISAVTLEQLDLYLEGYRPLRNIQGDLRRSVGEYLRGSRRIIELVDAHRLNALPAPLPADTRTEDLVVPPPARGNAGRRVRAGLTAGVLTAADDFRRRELGRGGEELVVSLERASLSRAGRPDLADQVRWASLVEGDGLGYDISSFRHDGSARWIEVKTTNFGIATPFYITRNEVAVSVQRPDVYSLYRVFDFRVQPRLYMLDGSVEETAQLDPYIYVGTPR